jgi:hypothetical protein
LLRRQASEQYFTSAQFFAQRRRQLIARPQTAQGLLGNAALLPRKLALIVTMKTRGRQACSRLLCPSAAPTRARDLLGTEQRATARLVGRLALVERTVDAVLAGNELGKLLDVDALGIGHVAQRDGLGILFVEHGLGLCASGKRCAASTQSHQKHATGQGLMHLKNPGLVGEEKGAKGSSGEASGRLVAGFMGCFSVGACGGRSSRIAGPLQQRRGQ